MNIYNDGNDDNDDKDNHNSVYSVLVMECGTFSTEISFFAFLKGEIDYNNLYDALCENKSHIYYYETHRIEVNNGKVKFYHSSDDLMITTVDIQDVLPAFHKLYCVSNGLGCEDV
jgi:hypothetical protein